MFILDTGNGLLDIIREQSTRLNVSPILMATKLFCSKLVSIGNSNIEQSDNVSGSINDCLVLLLLYDVVVIVIVAVYCCYLVFFVC